MFEVAVNDTDTVPVVDWDYWDGSHLRGMTMGIMPHGKNRIYKLGQEPGFAVAHRSGSDNYAEYSHRGYTECVARGVMALELSVSRSQDGVWFGLHDRTLTRTSSVTGYSADPYLNSWNYIRSLPNNNVGSDPDPAFPEPQEYVEIHELLAPYVDSHVLLLDLKFKAGEPEREEILEILDELYDEPREQVIFKFADARATSYADWIASIGYTSWGHIWTNDYLADPVAMNEAMDHWDWLGVAADATAQLWLDAQAQEKPMLGAIVNDPAELAIVLGEGCIGYLCADPIELLGPSLV
jgi:glycerophosphoryl diester phosphodiesterase